METIFDCKFKPDDPNLLATASFDGTIKVWDINTLTALYTSPGNEGVIFALSWAPGKTSFLLKSSDCPKFYSNLSPSPRFNLVPNGCKRQVNSHILSVQLLWDIRL